MTEEEFAVAVQAIERFPQMNTPTLDQWEEMTADFEHTFLRDDRTKGVFIQLLGDLGWFMAGFTKEDNETANIAKILLLRLGMHTPEAYLKLLGGPDGN